VATFSRRSIELTVFTDKEKLSPYYIPPELLHRNAEMKLLQEIFDGFLEKPGKTSPKILRIQGPIGSGKTSTVMSFGKSFEGEAVERKMPLKFIYVNCKLEAGSRFLLYRKLLEKISPDILSRGLSPEEMLSLLISYMLEEKFFVIIALDEIDYLIRRMKEQKEAGSPIYDLTRIHEVILSPFSPIIGVIFISKDFNWGSLLDPSERSSLGDIKVVFSNYLLDQLKDILTERAGMAFKKGAIPEDIIEYVADIAANKSLNPGDCRFALDILFYAGLTADSKGSTVIRTEHVRLVVKESFPGIRTEDLMLLSEREFVSLRAVVKTLKNSQRPYTSLQETWEYYLSTCEEEGVEPESYNSYRNRVQDLNLHGLLEYKGSRRISITGATMEDFDRILLILGRKTKHE
jgi:archaeal cell division control protein 6